MHLGKNWVELAPQAWQAYPLSIVSPGAPHILEVEYPSNVEQTLGISIVEPNAAGQVGPIGLDSGIDVPAPEAGHKPGVRRHRLVFWPHSKTPYLLLANRREFSPAMFGKIDVQGGPLTLTPLALSPTTSTGRMLAAYYDKPLFAENFSASESVDPVSRRGLDDWQTFGGAGERLIQTLQYSGFNAVVLTAACEGSAIYPSQLLEPTPKYDSGVFFESGQDAVRKDVLELLFRLCDRSGLVLIPAIHFAAPLPELEAIRAAGGTEAVGLEPIGPDGRTWLGRGNGHGGVGVYYNALDPRVQRAMSAVVAELAERYAQHASFGGVAVHLSADSYAVLPDETCSLDDVTFATFLQETQTAAPNLDRTLAARLNFLRNTAEKKWLDWRAQKLTGLYQQMRDEIVRHRPEAKLYLTTANLLGGRQLQAALRPELPARNNVAEILPLLGLDLDRLNEPNIIVPRPQRIVVGSTPQIRDQERHWNRHAGLDLLFARPTGGSSLHFLVPAPQRLADFDAVSPFGADKTRTLLISQIAPADASQRERFVQSLARLDATLMIDGGWLMPLGQEAALAPLFKVYRRLPAEPFETVRTAVPQPQELVVRTLTKPDKTYFYAVNPTPWPLTAQIQFASTQPLRLLPYADERIANLQQSEGGATWTVELEPFDLVGGEVAGSKATVVKWSVTAPPEAGPTLSEQSRDVTRRAHHLHDHQRFLPLVNASFEDQAADGSALGWFHARGEKNMLVEVDPRQGSALRKSLHMARSNAGAPVWVRSSPLPSPTTGRIQVIARIRSADGVRQPQLRMAIEGRLDGQVYYRHNRAREHGEPDPPPLTTEWGTWMYSVTNLPLSGLTDLRVGFDLMGDGEVWIDDVQISDLWLRDGERGEFSELIKSASTAHFQAKEGGLNESRLFVEGYWPSFLRRHVQLAEGRDTSALTAGGAAASRSLPPVASRPKEPSSPVQAAPPANSQQPGRTAERSKSWWPTWPWK
jgi:hypothetical protein